MLTQRGTASLVLAGTLGGVGCVSASAIRPLSDLQPGRTTLHALVTGTQRRTFYLHLPPGFSPEHANAVLVLAHGHGGTGALVLRQSGLAAVADRDTFLVVAPNGSTGRFGLGRSWHVGTCCGRPQRDRVDDLGFLEALLDTLTAPLGIDRRRVAVAGFSAGGMMALHVACDRTALAGTVVNVQGTMPDTACTPQHPVNVLLIEGDADRDMRAEHDDNTRRNGNSFATSALGALRFWAAHNGCAATVASTAQAGYVTWIAEGCPSGAATQLVTVKGHPHAWPGGRRTWRLAPTPSPSLNASEYLVDFWRSTWPAAR